MTVLRRYARRLTARIRGPRSRLIAPQPEVVTGRAGTGRPGRSLVAAEGLLQPPGAVRRGDLGVDHQRSFPRPVQPRLHRAQVVEPPDGYAVAAEAAPDLGDVHRGEPDDIHRM